MQRSRPNDGLDPPQGCFTGFSVIVPTYRRAPQLQGCLAALSRQGFSAHRFEVIVVNDGGPCPRQVDLCRAAGERICLQLLHQANAGPAGARNAGARRARFSHLAFTDDDCEPEPDWLLRLAQACQAAPAAMVGTLTRNGLGADRYAQASQIVVGAAYRWHNRDPGRAAFLASNNMVCPRGLFLALGGFSAPFRTAEDRDLCHRWLQAGGRIVQLDAVLVTHHHALNFAAFWRQHRCYGRGAYHYHRAKARRGGGGLSPDLRFLLLLLRESLALRSGSFWSRLRDTPVVGCLALLSQLASLQGYLEARLFAVR
ncbi:MAG: glycosyltransferase [Synechococcaceae cyanobacterium]|nr:glycosyltransferase [Synechococcaceae cyanobacterium]